MSSQHEVFIPAVVPHPGEIVTEYLEFNGWSQRDLARRTALTPKTISEVCNGKATVSPTTALALEKAFQRPASFWLNLQRQFDEAEARREESARSQEWAGWARRFPLKEMRRWGLLPQQPQNGDVQDLLFFLGVSSPESWDAVWNSSRVALRQSHHHEKSVEALAVWLRAVEMQARKLVTAEYSEHMLRASLDPLRKLSRLGVDTVMEPIQELCARAGVAVVWIPELRKTAISGCARWLNDRRPVIGLSLRYKTDDQMWFTLFHEIGHLLLHRKRDAFIIDTGEVYSAERDIDPEMQRIEEEASRFAADTLIPPSELSKFLQKKSFTNDAIHDFAEAVGVGPGIVVGRLQHDGVLEPFQGNKLKQKLDFGITQEEPSGAKP
jgi:HTH-type transcriptional regulator / antitoxin HigA